MLLSSSRMRVWLAQTGLVAELALPRDVPAFCRDGSADLLLCVAEAGCGHLPLQPVMEGEAANVRQPEWHAGYWRDQ